MGGRLNFNIRYQNIHHWNKIIQLKIKSFDSLKVGVRIVLGFIGKETSPIVGQRVSRTYRNIQLHSKLWSNYLPKSNNVNHRRWALGLLLSSLCTPKFDVIADHELLSHKTDLDYIHKLTKATVVCPKCNERLVVTKKMPGVKYCPCPDSNIIEISKQSGYPWAPFVETSDLLIWRQPHPEYDGLYIYKVYGHYDDVSAEDFLTTQLDLEYRKTWDNLVLELRIVDKDTKTKSEIVYWEMKWPRMFSNRDYCFVRRHLLDRDSKTIVIMSKAVTHPDVSEVKGTVRVSEYWSVMQIKAVKGMNERGVEFGLTYFDNPGLSLPNWMITWASMAGIPDFLSKVRHAARNKRDNRTFKLTVGTNEISKTPNNSTSNSSSNNNNSSGSSGSTTSSTTTTNIPSTSRPTPTPSNATYTSNQTPANNNLIS